MSSSDSRRQLTIEGIIPGASAGEAKILRARMLDLVRPITGQYERSGRPLEPFSLLVRYTQPDAVRTDLPRQPGGRGQPGNGAPPTNSDDDVPEFVAIEPNYRLDQVVLPDATREALLDCVSFVEVAPLVFDVWGLRAVEPHPSIAVNFRGPPGTGKTMAAHAAASHLGKKIMLSRISDLESKYHGQGPKNLAGLFKSAKDQDAVIFIDEAESLLSRRYAQPEQAAESAINSMRTELLMALDAFDGLVIFASNLPDSYDVAIESRLLHVDFALPDQAARQAIWRMHCRLGFLSSRAACRSSGWRRRTASAVATSSSQSSVPPWQQRVGATSGSPRRCLPAHWSPSAAHISTRPPRRGWVRPKVPDPCRTRRRSQARSGRGSKRTATTDHPIPCA